MIKQKFGVGDKLKCIKSSVDAGCFTFGYEYEIVKVIECNHYDYMYKLEGDDGYFSTFGGIKSLNSYFDVTLFERKIKLKQLENIQ